MEVVGLPQVEELAVMPVAAVESVLQAVELGRRLAEAHTAVAVQRIQRAGTFRDDGYRTVAAWGRATCDWSHAEAKRIAALADAFAALPSFAQACLAGDISVSAMHAVALTAANPRVTPHLAEADDLFTQWARTLDHPDLVRLLQHWAQLADPDGALSRHDRAHHQRRAHVGVLGESFVLDAVGPSAAGALVREVFDRFRDAQWRTEWDEGVAVHGDAMVPALMPRTDAQRNFDALVAVFQAAAGSTQAGAQVVVNVVVDQATFEHHLLQAVGDHTDAPSPATAGTRRCDDSFGNPVDPRAVVAAALVGQVRRIVLDQAGVVVDVGRKRRLFTGPTREAVLLVERRCVWRGCRQSHHHCHADHVVPFADGGATSSRNGAPLCGPHNVWKNHGYRTYRDADGLWHTFRPDGSELGWPARRVRFSEAA